MDHKHEGQTSSHEECGNNGPTLTQLLNNETNAEGPPNKRIKTIETIPSSVSTNGEVSVVTTTVVNTMKDPGIPQAERVQIQMEEVMPEDLSRDSAESHIPITQGQPTNGGSMATNAATSVINVSHIVVESVAEFTGSPGDGPVKCSFCGREFSKVKFLKLHLKTHSTDKFTCDFCQRIFTHKGGYQRHLLTHTAKKTFECKKCWDKFADVEALREHVAKAHNRPDIKEHSFQCTLCAADFKTENGLKKHVESHSGMVWPLKCPECSATFLDRQRLRVHMLVHSGEKPYTCQICTRSFASWNMMQNHMKSDHPTVTISDDMTAQTLEDTSQSPKEPQDIVTFNCMYCTNTFQNQNDLLSHLMTHSGEFKCGVCNKVFSYYEELKNHLSQAHSEVAFDKCELVLYSDAAQENAVTEDGSKPRTQEQLDKGPSASGGLSATLGENILIQNQQEVLLSTSAISEKSDDHSLEPNDIRMPPVLDGAV